MYLLIGIGTGVLSGLLGVGGGIVMVPALVGLGYTRHFVNTGNHFVDWRAMVVLGIVGAITAPFATSFALQTPAATLSRAFGLFAIAVAIQTILRSRKPPASVPA